MPGTITGNLSPCLGELVTYSVPAINGLTYTWSFDEQYGIIDTNHNEITILWTDSSAVSFSIVANNLCGASNPRFQTVDPVYNSSCQRLITIDPDTVNRGQFVTVAMKGELTNWTASLAGCNGIVASNIKLRKDTVEFLGSNVTVHGTDSLEVEFYIPSNAVLGDYDVEVWDNCPAFTKCFECFTIEDCGSAPVLSDTISGSQLVCDGMLVEYSLPFYQDVTYNWSVSSGGSITQDNGNTILVTWNASGSETIDVFISNACGSSNTVSVNTTIQANTLSTPTISQVGSDSLTCNETASQYIWLLDGAPLPWIDQTIGVTQIGNYQVIMVDPPCNSDTSAAFFYNIQGIDKEDRGQNLKVFPNPNDGDFRIELENNRFSNPTIFLYDTNGRMILHESIFLSENIIEVRIHDTEEGGAYFIRISDNEHATHGTAIIQR